MKYHANKSKKGDYRSYYTNEMIDKVKIRFKDDLYLLDYTFEDFKDANKFSAKQTEIKNKIDSIVRS